MRKLPFEFRHFLFCLAIITAGEFVDESPAGIAFARLCALQGLVVCAEQVAVHVLDGFRYNLGLGIFEMNSFRFSGPIGNLRGGLS